jgi:hypothetical protein
MKTDDLIDLLAKAGEAPAVRARPWALAALLGLLGGVLLLMATIAPRPDMELAIYPIFAKAAFSAAFAALGLGLVGRLARPGGAHRNWLMLLVGLGVISMAIAGVALMGAEPDERMRALTDGAIPWCLVFIPVLAIPAAIALGAVVRTLAPTRLALTGAAIGAAAGGIGAMAYALHCPVDSIAFVSTWYACGIAISAVLGAVAGQRLLRW